MANTIIHIKRSYVSGSPGALKDGELAYSFASNTLWIGNQSNTPVIITDALARINSTYAFIQANSAYSSQNTTGIYANSAFAQANLALSGSNSSSQQTNSAFTQANSAYASQNTTGIYANSAYASQNTTGIYANSAFLQANSAYASQNISGSYANSAYAQANSASIYANGAFAQANASYGSQNTTGSYANSAFTQANSSFGIANSASVYANGAFIQANSAYASQNVSGSYANSAYYTANSASVYANGAFIQANAAYGSQNTTGSYANSAYYTANSAQLYANGAFIQANAAYNSQNATGSYANSAFGVANNALPKAGGTITGSLIINQNLTVTGNATFLGNSTIINSSTIDVSDPLIFLANSNYTSDAVDIGFVGHYNATGNAHTGLFRDPNLKEYIFFQGYIPEVQSNNLINIADPSFAYANVNANTFKGNVIANTVYIKGFDALGQINGAFIKANSAYDSQNTTGSYANSAYAQANAAYLRANNSINANTGGTVTGNLIVANTFVAFYNPSYTNWLQATGSNTGNAVIFSATGGDTNVSMLLQPKGTGAIDLAAGSSGVNISNGGTVTAITRTAAGSAYTSPPSVAISAPTTAGGVQATATTLVQNNVVTPTITSGGTGYTAGDTLTLVGGTGTASTLTVSTVSGGVITAISTATQGAYSVVPTNPISVTGGTGSGATFTINSYGIYSIFTITNAGSGYVEQPTVSFSGGGGSGAAAYATVGSAPIIRSLSNPLSFYTPGGEAFRIGDAGVASNSYFTAFGGNGSSELRASGPAIISSVGASNINFRTNTTLLQFLVAHTASAVNYVQVTGAATGLRPTISTQGSDASVNLDISGKGFSRMFMLSNGARQAEFTYGNQTAGVNGNHVKMLGNAAGTAPVYSVEGSDTNIDLNLITKGTGNTNIQTANGTQLRIADVGAGQNAVNYLQVQGSNTANAIVVSSQGSDANISMVHITKGNGSFDIQTTGGAVVLSNGNTVTAITGTAGGSYTVVPTITISAPTTAGGTQATGTVGMAGLTISLASGGSGYAIGDTITLTGGTFTQAIVLIVATLSGSAVATFTTNNFGTYSVLATNPISQGSSSGAGTGATFNVTAWQVRTTAYTITNAGSGYVEQPTVTFSSGSATAYAVVGSGSIVRGLGTTTSFYTPSGELLRLNDLLQSTPAYTQLEGTSTALNYRAQGAQAGIGFNFVSKGTIANAFAFSTGSSIGTYQFIVSHTNSAVNYVQATGGTTGNGPTISFNGSDASVGGFISTKAGGGLSFMSQGGVNRQFRIEGGVASVNYLQVVGSLSGSGPSLSSLGTDSNIDLSLVAKGSGNVTTSSAFVSSNTVSSIANNTGAMIIAGGVGITGNVYVGYNSVMGFANSSSISASYQYYNQATNSLDTVFA